MDAIADRLADCQAIHAQGQTGAHMRPNLSALPHQVLGASGLHPTSLDLGAMGIPGNGNMTMLEKNLDHIAEAVSKL
jgi:hypothetical protein